MSRSSSSAINTATSQPHVPYCVFVDLAFDSGHVLVCSGYRSYTFGGNTYSGLGEFGSIDQVTESAQLVPDKLQLTLTGVDNSLITTALAETYKGRSVTIYIGYLIEAGDLVDTPYTFWEGRMSVMSIEADVNSSIIQIICENRLILWNKSPGWLDTVEHRAFLMGSTTDNFFDQLSAIQNRSLHWGDASVATTPRGTPPFPGPGSGFINPFPG